MTKEESGLYAFYDPSSRRMKAAAISSDGDLVHRGRIYRTEDYWGEHDFIWSKSGKLIGFGIYSVGVVPAEKQPGFGFRSPINALNAVVNGKRNDLNPERDTFSEVIGQVPFAYWWLTETYDEFKEKLWDKRHYDDDDYPTDGASWAGNEPYVWEGIVNGKPDGDFILLLEFFGEDFGIDKIGFKLATENIPNHIPDLQSLQNPSSRDSQTSTSSL